MPPPRGSSSGVHSRKGNKRSVAANSRSASPATSKPSLAASLPPAARTVPRPPYCPSFSVAFKFFLIVRFTAAVYSNISDCDEVFNYWEDSHFLQYGFGLQTWEYSPEYAIRSWAYAGLHALVGAVFALFVGNKMQIFYFIRITLGVFSAYCETTFYRAVVNEVNPHVGRYVLVALLSSAGMFNAATAYLPSTFAMYTTLLATSYALRTPSNHSRTRTYGAVFWFGAGALLGWPFSAAVGVPFAAEELLVHGREVVVGANAVMAGAAPGWRLKRTMRLAGAVAVCLVVILGPIMAIDYVFYKKLVVVPMNIIAYNVFGGKEKGPDIYGTEPWWFYILNGLLNFNLLFLLALTSGVCLAITSVIDPGRLGPVGTHPTTAHAATSPYTVIGLKLAPFYLWLAIFTLQPHKEERFLFVVYPLICFNASVALFLIKGWLNKLGVMLGVKPGLRQPLLSYITAAVLLLSTLVSVSRALGLYFHYHAPLDLYTSLWTQPLKPRFTDLVAHRTHPATFCIGKEWYRFPSSYFLPAGMRLRFVESEFRGLLPGEFAEDWVQEEDQWTREWRWNGTWIVPKGMNDLNREEKSRYVPVSTCDYLVDVDFPHRFSTPSAPLPPPREPRYALNAATWERLSCLPFLDAEHSSRWSRAFWVPGAQGREWGEYCLLRQRIEVEIEEAIVTADVEEDVAGVMGEGVEVEGGRVEVLEEEVRIAEAED